MEIINLADTPSLASRYMRELRDVKIQRDPLRFRRNIERIGEILAYEISKRLNYAEESIKTPLCPTIVKDLNDKVVLATILRAGLPFHQGFLNFFWIVILSSTLTFLVCSFVKIDPMFGKKEST